MCQRLGPPTAGEIEIWWNLEVLEPSGKKLGRGEGITLEG